MTEKNVTTERECASMHLLARDGWTSGELGMCFHICRKHDVRNHAFGRCGHTHGIPVLSERNGENGEKSSTTGLSGGSKYTLDLLVDD